MNRRKKRRRAREGGAASEGGGRRRRYTGISVYVEYTSGWVKLVDESGVLIESLAVVKHNRVTRVFDQRIRDAAPGNLLFRTFETFRDFAIYKRTVGKKRTGGQIPIPLVFEVNFLWVGSCAHICVRGTFVRKQAV